MTQFNKNTNHPTNDGLYLTMKDWRDVEFATIQKWFYELIFYKKSLFSITTDKLYGDEQVLYDFRKVNRFNCGITRKRKLLTQYGHTLVKINFSNGKTECLPVDRILILYGWKYLLQNIRNIIDMETGEVLFGLM